MLSSKVNIQEYIESGILEAYVLGALPADEQARVAADIAMYPELAAEVAAIEEGVLQFAQANAQEPPPHLQEQIWNAIQQNSAVPVEEPVQPQSKTIPFAPPAPVAKPAWQRAAVWAAVGASVLTNFMLLSQRNKLKDEQVVMQQRMDSLQQKQQYLTTAMDNAAKEKEMMADSSMQTIVMKSMKPGHPMAATVYWNKVNGDAYLAMKKLPMPPQGMQYQMWVIQEGKPVSMGVLPNAMVEGAIVSRLPMNVKGGQAFAISLEKEGGNPTPTEVYVLGNI